MLLATQHHHTPLQYLYLLNCTFACCCLCVLLSYVAGVHRYTVTTVLQPSPEASLSFRLRNDGDVADFRFAVNTTAWYAHGGS